MYGLEKMENECVSNKDGQDEWIVRKEDEETKVFFSAC